MESNTGINNDDQSNVTVPINILLPEKYRKNIWKSC